LHIFGCDVKLRFITVLHDDSALVGFNCCHWQQRQQQWQWRQQQQQQQAAATVVGELEG
jgi:hypothetical protein